MNIIPTCIYFFFFSFYFSASTHQIYLTPSEQAILLPHYYFNQSESTTYAVEGNDFEQIKALEEVRKYELQFDAIAFDVWFSVNDAQLITTLDEKQVLYFGTIQYEYIDFYFQISLKEYDVKNSRGILAVKNNQTLIWTALNVLKIQVLQAEGKIGFIKHINLTNQLNHRMEKCAVGFPQNTVICSSKRQVIYLRQTLNTLELVHLYNFDKHQCIVNAFFIDVNILALCDCQNGCYNYLVDGKKLEEICHLPIYDNILVMKQFTIAQFSINMAIVTENDIKLLRWSPININIVYSTSYPQRTLLKVVDISIENNYIGLTYSNNEHIFIYLDAYEEDKQILNEIVTSPNIFMSLSLLYSINNRKLTIRQLNPNYFIIPWQNKSTFIIHAFHPIEPSETVTFQIEPVMMGDIVIKKNLSAELKINYKDQAEYSLYSLYTGNKAIEFDMYVGNKKKEISPTKTYKILSLYNQLQCLSITSIDRMIQRITKAPTNKLYIQYCEYRDEITNYFCKLMHMIPIPSSQASFIAKHEKFTLWQQSNNSLLTIMDDSCRKIETNDGIYGVFNQWIIYTNQNKVFFYNAQTQTIRSRRHERIRNITVDKNYTIISTAHNQSEDKVYLYRMNEESIKLQRYVYLPAKAQWIRKYKYFLFWINNTHIVKYSTLNIRPVPLFDFEIGQTENIHKIIVEDEYMVILFQKKYILLDLKQSKFSFEMAKQEGELVCGISKPDENQLLIAIKNNFQTYNLNYFIQVGDFPLNSHILQKRVNVSIQPTLYPSLRLNQTLITTYETFDINLRSNYMKHLELPYTAEEETLIIYQTMFVGPILEYFISDSYDGQLNFRQHIEELDQIPLSMKILNYIQQYEYECLQNNNPMQNQIFGFWNETHYLMANYKEIILNIGINNTHLQCTQYATVSSTDFVVFCAEAILYLYGQSLTYEMLEVEGQYWGNGVIQWKNSDLILLVIEQFSEKTLSYINASEENIQINKTELYDFQFIKSKQDKILVGRTKSICFGDVGELFNQGLALSCVLYEEFIPQGYLLQGYLFSSAAFLHMTTQNFTFLLFSHDKNSLNLQIQVNINANIWEVVNGYWPLADLDFSRLAGVKLNQSHYDYFMLVYESKYSTYLVFYRHNDNFLWTKNIGDISQGFSLQLHDQILYIGNYLVINTQWFQVKKNLTLTLNYSSPPPLTYLAFHGKNPLSKNIFYSKLMFEKQNLWPWFYCGIAFSIVLVMLLICRILRELMDRGIINWSFNSEEEVEEEGTLIESKSYDYSVR